MGGRGLGSLIMTDSTTVRVTAKADARQEDREKRML